ncbi:MAG: hypothetical protein KGJ13_06290 [Patescibacteria group bacterium]|nr:hypothetical protein [Patescibacteria group bacterium]
MNELVSGSVSIALAIVGIAILAVLVSKNANTAGVIGASGSAFSNALTAAEGPVLGNFALGNTTFGPGYYNG